MHLFRFNDGFDPSFLRYLRSSYARPHMALAFLLRSVLGCTPSEILSEFLDLPLTTVESRVSDALQSRFGLSRLSLSYLLCELRAHLRRNCLEHFGAALPLDPGRDWTDMRVGATTMGDYLRGRDARTLNLWIRKTQKAILRAVSLATEREEFERYYHEHCHRVAGYVARRLKGRSRAMDDVLGETWLAAWMGWSSKIPRTQKYILNCALVAVRREWEDEHEQDVLMQSIEGSSAGREEDLDAVPEIQVSDPGAATTGERAMFDAESDLRVSVLRLLLLGKLLPHEALCFGLARVQDMEPSEVIARWAYQSLWLMALELEHQLSRRTRIDPAELREILQPFFTRLKHPLKHKDFNPTKAAHHDALRHRIVGDTCLMDYVEDPSLEKAVQKVNQWIGGSRRHLCLALMKSKNPVVVELLDQIIEANEMARRREARAKAAKAARARQARLRKRRMPDGKNPDRGRGRKGRWRGRGHPGGSKN